MSFEAESEAIPLTPEQEAELRAIVVARAPKELAAMDAAESDEELFYALPRAAIAAILLEKYE